MRTLAFEADPLPGNGCCSDPAGTPRAPASYRGLCLG